MKQQRNDIIDDIVKDSVKLFKKTLPESQTSNILFFEQVITNPNESILREFIYKHISGDEDNTRYIIVAEYKNYL